MEEPFTYHAFICGAEEDMRFALKLQRYISHYRLPSVLCRKYPHIPRRLLRLFLESLDTLSLFPNEHLSKVLPQSRHLIVICSETSASPDSESGSSLETVIDAFTRCHPNNDKRIIPIIHRHDTRTRANACLPPAIKQLNLLAADPLDKGEERVFNDVIAKMLGLKPDTLWNRHERERRRQRRLWQLGTGLATALTAAAGWAYWDYTTPHTRYYTDYIERHNIPEGLFELTQEEVAQRHRHYRFTTQHHRLVRVEYCNAAGSLQEHTERWNKERPAAMLFRHNEEDNKADERVHLNAWGKESGTLKYAEGAVEFVQATPQGEETWQSVEQLLRGLSMEARPESMSTIGRMEQLRHESGAHAGIISRELYQHIETQAPAQDPQGIGGREYQLDALGRPTELRYLRILSPADGTEAIAPAETKTGISGYQLSYTPGGQVAALTCINREGAPTFNEEHWAQQRFEYNEQGNVSTTSFHDAAGHLCRHKEGYSRITYRYDAHGNRIETAYQDAEGKPCESTRGYASEQRRYNERGYCIEGSFHAVDGSLSRLCGACSRWTARRDARGNIIEQAYFNADNEPCVVEEGYARTTWRYDERGNRLQVAYFGLDGKPCPLEGEGYARMDMHYDGFNRLIGQDFFGVDDKPTLIGGSHAGIRIRYDEQGNIASIMRLDEDGKPSRSALGHTELSFKFDASGHPTLITWCDADGRPTLQPEQYAQIRVRYEQGQLVDIAYLGVNGSPCRHARGHHRITARYDRRGNRTEMTFYDTDGKLFAPPGGVARFVMEYDERGNMTKRTTYRADGSLNLMAGIVAWMSFEYDEKGNLVATNYHDSQGKVILRK